MDFLERPEVKNTYDKCKYTVKVWEHDFKKRHGRLPSKLDIREADKKVRDAYKRYYQIKTAALEQSFKDVEGFNSDEEVRDKNVSEPTNCNGNTSLEPGIEKLPDSDTWGFHLDKKPEKKKENNLNTSVTTKIFCGSKLSKRYSRKSFSFTQKKNDASLDNSQSKLAKSSIEKNDEAIREATDLLSFEGIFSKNVKITSVSDKVTTQPTNIVQSVLDNRQKSLKTVDSGWLERVAESSGVPIEKSAEVEPPLINFEDDTNMSLDYNSDDIIDNSDEERSINLGNAAKKLKIDLPQSQIKEISNKENFLQINNTQKDPYEFEDDVFDGLSNNSVNVKKDKVKKVKKKLKPQSIRQSNRSTKTKVIMTESHSEDEDPFHSDNDSNDPEFTINKTSNNSKTMLQDSFDKKYEKLTKKNKLRTKNNEDDNQSTYELEFSVKPRVAAPRFENLKELIKIETSSAQEQPPISDKRSRQKEKLEKKIRSGNLNENFVAINLKKKIYCRARKTASFAKYKKQQWRDRKRALAGCDGGTLACFNCGDAGHMAGSCAKAKGDALLPPEAAEELRPCPTLEEAEEGALGPEKRGLDESDDDALLAEALKLEEYVAEADPGPYLDRVKIAKPYYDGSVTETPEEVFAALRRFGHSSFRPGQEEAVMRVLSGKSTLVTSSTGSGKSLCYQIPAYLYSRREPCVTLVVSPLVSLMEDQVSGIPSFLKAACLHTNQSKSQREKVMEALAEGNLSVLFVSPEAVVAGERSTGFGSLLRRLPPIAFACIDEAHCVSQWSHNFRPGYLMICRVLRERIGVATVLGLTATATRATADAIIRHLGIPDGRGGVVGDVPLPANLVLTVSKDRRREQALLALLASDRFGGCRSVIVYCTRREECVRIATFLRTGLQRRGAGDGGGKRKRISTEVEAYHAGLSAARRRSVQRAFMSGELKVVVATVAFGMGINKADIRAVVHYNMPKSFESYVQEIGRAGRDGLEAHCHLFLDSKGNDENELRRHIYANSVDRHVIRKLLQRVFQPCSCKETCPKHEVAFSIEETVRALDIPEENVSTLLCYLELHEKNYVELLSPAYTVCRVVSYGGPSAMRRAAQECPPLATALALRRGEEGDPNVLEFAVVDVAAAIGWDSGICKHKLKNLEWSTVNGQPKRSALNVSFSNLGFRLLAPGNLTDDQLDEALDSLYEHVVNQEKTALLQLHAVHQTLLEAAAPTYESCLSVESNESNDKLKEKIREYFESPNPLDSVSLPENKQIVDEEQIINNIRGLICTYKDNNFTGRAIARIFHGIVSPNYPAVIWGRCKYWRCHLNVDFHTICKLATKEILNFR